MIAEIPGTVHAGGLMETFVIIFEAFIITSYDQRGQT